MKKHLCDFPSLIAILLYFGMVQTANGISAVRIAYGLDDPIYATAPPNDPSRLFIVERGSDEGSSRTGNIKILDLNTNTVDPTPFLTIPNLSNSSLSEGLFSIAFHPNYEQNGFFYVNAMDSSRTSTIRRYTVSPDNPNVAKPDYTTLLEYPQLPSHNNNWIGFGPDGYLYVTNGDGGGTSHDRPNNAQNINDIHGAILRLDVGTDGLADDFPSDTNRNYAIPLSNPYVGRDGLDEIWATGLRNPWRASFDRKTGDFYIGDVGQEILEEINFQPAGSSGGANYGWRLREGTVATPRENTGGPKPFGNVDPVFQYTHGNGTTPQECPYGNFGEGDGCSITGGYVYRGPIEELQGQYFFADFVNPRIWSIEADVSGLTPDQYDGANFKKFTDWTNNFAQSEGVIDSIVSFAEDANGNLYIVSIGNGGLGSNQGAIYKIVPEPASILLLLVSGSIIAFRRINTAFS
ncbi:PQQ-dependent sugar dehydrogenase [Bythopirellula goksoeyrii]|uniref:Glucose/Sorbosone dehydrogenase domain-containing protein n=1 Tax=Bythopirellula goksoeyrii TaxID=1400387 RepID=A0A5B9QF48_9BACT|nr:PQQ-dependent sugar dehydrogenase [Bythopirellula goksoeyrii]QEG36270.1 hypothetical protein Pr1d_35820 [Bythopirellula goksoeyrii]